jgi:hypothetical protein
MDSVEKFSPQWTEEYLSQLLRYTLNLNAKQTLVTQGSTSGSLSPRTRDLFLSWVAVWRHMAASKEWASWNSKLTRMSRAGRPDIRAGRPSHSNISQ